MKDTTIREKINKACSALMLQSDVPNKKSQKLKTRWCEQLLLGNDSTTQAKQTGNAREEAITEENVDQ